MSDFSSFENAKDWLIGVLLGGLGWALGQVRRSDVRLLEERIARLEKDISGLAAKIEDLLP